MLTMNILSTKKKKAILQSISLLLLAQKWVQRTLNHALFQAISVNVYSPFTSSFWKQKMRYFQEHWRWLSTQPVVPPKQKIWVSAQHSLHAHNERTLLSINTAHRSPTSSRFGTATGIQNNFSQPPSTRTSITSSKMEQQMNGQQFYIKIFCAQS